MSLACEGKHPKNEEDERVDSAESFITGESKDRKADE